MKFKTEWYCHHCWQEGVIETEQPVEDPAKHPDIIKTHREIVRGFIGGGKCSGDIRLQEHNPKRRIRREPPPPLEFTGEPIPLK